MILSLEAQTELCNFAPVNLSIKENDHSKLTDWPFVSRQCRIESNLTAGSYLRSFCNGVVKVFNFMLRVHYVVLLLLQHIK